jgi:hypothetical protein
MHCKKGAELPRRRNRNEGTVNHPHNDRYCVATKGLGSTQEQCL